MDYSYPISIDWSTQEIIEVVKFFSLIEDAYEKGVQREHLMDQYRKFKKIVPSMAEEKKLFKEFEESSGLSSYKVVKLMKESEKDQVIKMPTGK